MMESLRAHCLENHSDILMVKCLAPMKVSKFVLSACNVHGTILGDVSGIKLGVVFETELVLYIDHLMVLIMAILRVCCL